jgi:hypothetical protein
MPRLLVLNNYPLDTLLAEAGRRETPDHLLFGMNFFAEAGWKSSLLPVDALGGWRRLNRVLQRVKFPVPLGDLQQQRDAWRHLNECDLIFAACQTQTQALSYLRAVGLVRPPIVCLAHHPLDRGRLARLRAPFLRWQLAGVDAFPSLSAAVAGQINAIAPGRSEAIPWGPDATFYPPAVEPGHGILAVGRTGRDFATFGLGATATRAPVKIICPAHCVSPDFQRFGPNVEVNIQPNADWMRYPQLVEHYAGARALAIPHYGQESMVGLSSLMDALGMGKPVIMTRHPLVDVDIEKEGFGRWIEPGDIAGWRDAVAWFDQNPDAAVAMGRRARRMVAEGLDSRNFAKKILSIFAKVAGRNGPA